MRSDFTDAEKLLLQCARDAASAAYAPYSKFRVGAAVATDLGVFSACNVENASFGLSICAERAALFHAVASGAMRFDRIAVSCVDASPDAGIMSRMPCGACRQVAAEFLSDDAEIVVDGAGAFTMEELLPHAFRLKEQ